MRRLSITVTKAAVGFAALVGCGRGVPAGESGEQGGSGGERCDASRARVCVGNDVVACEAEGRLGRRLRACREGCERGRCVASCGTEGAQLIYAVDTEHRLLSFDPRKLPGDAFRVIGRLGCVAQRGPYSMAVDRQGMAWIVYDDGELFRVSIEDAGCERVAFEAGGTGLRRFGMGFATDTAGGTTERLFLSADDAGHTFGSMVPGAAGSDPSRALRPVRVGALTAARERSPELTGTSEAQLFGFYPLRGEPAFVQEIDRASGAGRGRRWMLGEAPLGEVSAWAFAQWGGVFYVFVTTRDGSGALDSTVRAIDRATGRYRVVLDHVPYRVTGAGVSTCAPERDGG